MASLTDIRDQLIENNQSQRETNDSLNALTNVFMKQFKLERNSGGDNLEKAYEANRTKGVSPQGVKPMEFDIAIPGKGMFDNIVIMAGNLTRIVAGFAAAIAATVAAFAGLRGWELKAVENIKTIGTTLDGLFGGSITGTIGTAMSDLKNGILRRLFGIGPDGKIVQVIGKNGDILGTKNLSVADSVAEAMSGLRTTVLNMFGIGADGKLIVVQGADGKFAPTRMGKVIMQLKSFFRPITTLSDAMGDFFKSPFFKNITDFLGAAGSGVLKAINKILWPIGFLFSAYEGITSYMESDADGFIAKLGDGFGGFFGDFIGAPFDLLKKGISWLMTNLLGFDENSPFMKKINEFSFEESIGNIVSGIFGMVQAGVDWIRDFFNDPAGTLGFDKFKTAAMDLFAGFVTKFQQLDAVISTNFEYQLVRLVNNFKNSLDQVITFVNNLGDELYLIIAKNLRFKLDPMVVENPFTGNPLFTIPGFDVGVGDEATRAAAEGRIDTRNTKMYNRIAERDANTADRLLASQEALAALTAGANTGQQVVINNVDNSQRSVTSQNQSSFSTPVSPVDASLPVMIQ